MGQVRGPVQQDPPQPCIIEAANEAPVEIENVSCMALIDTGSQVTTLALSFYAEHFNSFPLVDCSHLLRIEGAGGQAIPYRGYFIASVHIEGVDMNDVPILVVEDTEYNQSVPVLIGTNVLRRLSVLSDIKLHPNVKLALQAVHLEERHVSRSNGVYGTVYLDDSCTIGSGEVHTVCGKVRVTVPIPADVGLLTSEGMGNGLSVTPSLLKISTYVRHVNVEVINTEKHSIRLEKGIALAQVHQAYMVGKDEIREEDEGFFIKD